MHPRHTKLLDLICQNGRMAVTELSAVLGVSEVTIRKDLNTQSPLLIEYSIFLKSASKPCSRR